ncbi:MAG: cbb3-type cytochrome oxidase assembly protein CcoS [Sulfurospirillum sp.]|nr:cbb3-type cytochrome oxidase assembly protein CcoS [Sulfurospirillum sp.]
MDAWVIAMMLSASLMLGAFGLWALLWGLKTGQFDDPKKFLDGAQLDSEEALQDAIMLEKKKNELMEKKKREKEGGYAPPD